MPDQQPQQQQLEAPHSAASAAVVALVCLPDDDGSTAAAAAAAARVLAAASGLSQQVRTMQLLPGAAGHTQLAPQLLSCPSRHGGARLLTCMQPAAADGNKEATEATHHHQHAVLQHAAILLLALVSDSMLLLLPPSAAATGALPAQLLQLLDALQAVHTQLLHQAQAQASPPGTPHQQCSSSSSSLVQLLLDRKQPVQLHIGVQVPLSAKGPAAAAGGGEPTAGSSWQAAAGSAVQAATQALRTCRAVQPSAATSSSSISSRGGVLMELAGVHACCSDGGPNSVHAARRAVLHAIDRQLVLLNGQPQQQQQQKHQAVPADTLPGPEQLLAHVAAHVAASCSGATRAGSRLSAPQLWAQLLQLLFPDAAIASSDSSSNFLCNLFAQQPLVSANGDVQSGDEAASDDGGNNSSSCPDDGSEEEAWDEVQQQPDEGNQQQPPPQQQHQQLQQLQRRRQQAPGQLLAAAASPAYAASVRRCRRAAKQAVRGYLQAVPPQRYTAAVHDSALAAALQQFDSSASGPAAGELRQLLLATCRGVWKADRQQCPARSLTGHACTRGLHDGAQSDQQQEQQHSSGRRWCSYTPDGAAAASVDDGFSLHAANAAPAEQLLAERQSGLLLPVSIRLAVSSGPPHQLDPAASLARPTSGPLHELSLGPWMSSWFSHAAASSDAGMPGPGWLPGLNRLWQLQVPRRQQPQVQPTAGDQPAAQQPKPGKQQPQPQLQNQQPRPQKQQQRETLAAQLKRSVLGAPAPDPVLGPADFPTLQQAAGTGRRQRGAARTTSSQQQSVAGGPGAVAVSAAAAAADASQQQQQQQELVAAWSDMLQSSVGSSSGSAAPAPVLTSVLVGLEYERSSDGARAILQPQQLLALLAHQQQQQQQPANSRSRKAAGTAPQQQHKQRDMAAGRRPHAAAARARAGQAPASSTSGSASLSPQSLLSADIPLAIVLPADDKTARAAAPAAGDSTMQLRRLLVRTPPGPLVFASQPRLACSAAEQQQQHAGAGGTGRLEFYCQQRLRLPPDTLFSLCLPRVLAAPVDWAHTTNAAAAASAADAAVELHVAAATAATSDSPDSNAQARMLLPLIPMAAAGSSSSDGSSGAPPAWRGVLCAGSWLFPDSDPAGSTAPGA